MSSLQVAGPALGEVVIAVDPHKASWTAVAVDSRLQPLDALRVSVSKVGYRQPRRFAARWPDASGRSREPPDRGLR